MELLGYFISQYTTVFHVMKKPKAVGNTPEDFVNPKLLKT